MLIKKETHPMKVLHIVGNSRFGGAGWIIMGLGRIAQEEGWQVDVLATDPVFQQYLRQHGIGVVDLDVIRREVRPLWDFGGLVRLRGFLRREGYRIVHTHTSKGGFVGRLAASLADVPVIVHTVHGFAFHERSARPARLFYSALERVATRWCDRVVSVSEFHRHWALELGICQPREILAIPNGVAGHDVSSAATRASVRRRLGAREGDLLILSMARLAPDKGLNYLIEAASILENSPLRYRIVIAGEGAERERLMRLARDLEVENLVSFLGFRQDVGDLLAACDMVVLPSLREGLSITLLEAMAAGKAIIATDIGSHREVTSQAEMARLVPPADSRALADAILRLAADPASMMRLGIAAHALFESRYTEERMLDSYRQLYFDLLKRKCPGQATAKSPQRIDPFAGPVRLPCPPKGGGIWNER
jgi:glycosyltransferase involved in cell wall biosynthesis